MNRRAFLGTLLGATSVAAGAPQTPDSIFYREKPKRGVSILQGLTDPTSTQFSVLLPKGLNWTFQIVRQGGLPSFATIVVSTASRDDSSFVVHKLAVDGLHLKEVYLLKVYDSAGQLWDEREFSTLDLSARPVRMAFISCMLDLFHRDDIWEQFDRVDPEVVLFLGDNVYADRTSFWSKTPADEKQLWERYVLTRNRVAFYFQRRLRPVLATWDDHDFGADNSDGSFPWSKASRETFNAFFAQQDRPALQSGPGIASRWSAFGANFFLLDGRSFRGGGCMFGREQEDWLFSQLTDDPTWLINGSLFFGAYTGGESFEGQYPTNFKTFLSRLKEKRGGPICFASGDVHFSEIMDVESDCLGYKTFELVSSSMHSYTFPGHENRFFNPRRRMTSSAHNFVIFEGSFENGSICGQLICYSSSGEEFRSPVEVQPRRRG